LYQVKVAFDQQLGFDPEVVAEIKKVWEDRWGMMDSQLHGAGYCLDPEFWGDTGLGINNKRDACVKDLLALIKKVYPDPEEQKAARLSYMAFRDKEGTFQDEDAQADASSCAAHQWWKTYGGEHPELQKLAQRLLSQVTSACSCERAWSAYDFIHNKRRNRLSPARARDLVFVFTNGRLVEKMRYGGGASYVGWDEEEEEVVVAIDD
jgi:hypothetical protein